MRVPAFALALLLTLPFAPAVQAGTVGDCRVGAYRLAGGRVVDIAPTDGDTLRWRTFDGETGALHAAADGRWTSTFGWTDRPDGKAATFSCAKGRITFDGRTGKRIAFNQTETRFPGRGVDLAGRLVLPKGGGRVPIVVLVHGSERDSARDFYWLQRMLPAQGIGVFVYDKRGTGGSGGDYSQDFDLLADDAVAAMREARRLAGSRAGRVGYQGGSQGGWVVPLAANRAPVDFAIISFGLAVTVLEEDQQEVVLEMTLKGHSPQDIAKALEVARAAEAVIASGFTSGFDEFDAVRAKYRDEPWYKDLHGNFTWLLLPYDKAQLIEKGQALKWGTPWTYEPMPTLEASTTPQLWALGADDFEAPSAMTSDRIRSLQAKGLPFTLAVFPKAEHGLTEYEMKDGMRVSTRYAPGYLQMMADFIRTGRIGPRYGGAVIDRPN
ncbi:dienelactone hydrolase [Caulobacter ginsengisoli]|uniref:Dienelactone hydrolase n=1 Tax=Caulobacter ginsengisoli TaxID=400775 RepID=A0ABU0IQQ9_9CAUL|nr:prolyl oligopeptidase family serine peptidase [Caulobacter ginsengisoli]MDQ0464352.1 dienelactone hydrolase [Caulobacter ginsengisoli]